MFLKNVYRLWNQVSKYKSKILTGIIFNMLYSLFTVISIPLIIPFFQLLFDRMDDNPGSLEKNDIATWLQYGFARLIEDLGQQRALLMVCLAIVLVFFLKNLFRYLAMYTLTPVRTGLVRDLRSKLYNKYLHMPLSWYSEERKGDLISRINFDVQEVEWSIISMLETVVKSPLIIAGCLAFMIFISPTLTLFVLLLMIFTIVVIGFAGRRLKQYSSGLQTTMGMLTSQVEESLRGAKVIKGFGAENTVQRAFEEENKHYAKQSQTILRRRDLSSPLSEFLGVTTVAVLLWYGSALVLEGGLAPETFFAFIFAFYQVIEPSKAFSTAYYNLKKGMGAMDRISEILEQSPDLSEGHIPMENFEKEMRIGNVSFSYDPHKMVVRDVEFTLKRGEKLALIGESGSGKTTLVDLIMGFYKPAKGKIFIDGIEVSEICERDRKKLFGLVTQTPFLFHGTILENIRFGRDSCTLDDVIEAARKAQCHSFITALPLGYETNIGDDGVKLSGGQRQRITIARALVNNPPILIWDEATSSLDAESEEELQKSMWEWWDDKTVIIVAHRLSTIKNVDKIIVLSNGKIQQMGTHSELLNMKGDYRKYFQLQRFE